MDCGSFPLWQQTLHRVTTTRSYSQALTTLQLQLQQTLQASSKLACFDIVAAKQAVSSLHDTQ